MTKVKKDKPLIKYGWLRALIFFPAFLLFGSLLPAIYFAVHYKNLSDLTVFTDSLKGPNSWKPAVYYFAFSFLLSFVFRRWIDRKSLITLGLAVEGRGKEIISGIALGIFIVCASSLVLNLTGHLHWTDIIFEPRSIFISAGIIFLLAFSEELIFRGYILNNLLQSMPCWISVSVSALVFVFPIWSLTEVSGFFPLLSRLVMGIILGIYYFHYRNLWFPIFFHFAWVFMEISLLGVTGQENQQSLLQTELQGDANLTGGTSGLEGSFVLLAVAILSGIALYVFLRKKVNPVSLPTPDRI